MKENKYLCRPGTDGSFLLPFQTVYLACALEYKAATQAERPGIVK